MDDYRAVVIGATGAVGSALVRELLASPRCAAVVTLGRRAAELPADAAGGAKLTQRTVDMADLAALERAGAEAAAGCHAAFSTLGIGQPRKVSRDELWRVDVDCTAAFARGCRAAGVGHFSLLTSSDANPRARVHYFRVKGAAEEAVRALGFARASFFRPGLLVTREMRYGLQDRVTQAVYPLLSPLLPRRWHEIRVEDLARAMRANAERAPGADAVEVLHYPELAALLDG